MRTKARVRRAVVLTLLLALLAASLTLRGSGSRSVTHLAAAETPPNIVIVLTDDQRVNTTRWMPKVTRLLTKKGLTFTNAMLPTSLCCPSRSTILTGLYAHATGVYRNTSPNGAWPTFHDNGNEDRTIAVTLHQAGYRTGLVGKYINHFGIKAPEGYVPPGWDTFLTFDPTGGYYDYGLSDGTWYGTAPADYSTDVFAKRAVNFIDTAPADKPLFLYFAPLSPHAPYTPAPRWVDFYRGKLPSYHPSSVVEDIRDKPAWVRMHTAPMKQAHIDYLQRIQAESLMAVDDAVGSLVAELKAKNRMSNTLFLYLSDNGYLWGDHWLKGKSTPYRFSTSIPMIARWDGRLPADQKDSRFALNVDLARTIATAAGAAGPPTDGLDLFGDTRRNAFLLEAAPGSIADDQNGRPAYCGWRNARWLYVRYATREEELYSYRSDPNELHNLARNPAYHKNLTRFREITRSRCLPVPPSFTW
jgi:N-acetylglucosamine-6-sulfatase